MMESEARLRAKARARRASSRVRCVARTANPNKIIASTSRGCSRSAASSNTGASSRVAIMRYAETRGWLQRS